MDRYLKYAATALPMAVGVLYLIGVIYDSSYYAIWGVDSDQFSRTFNDTLVRGVQALLAIGSKYGFWSLVAAVVLLFSNVIPNIYYERKGKNTPEKADNSRDLSAKKAEVRRIRRFVPQWLDAAGVVSAVVAVLVSGFFIVTVAVSVLAFLVSSDARNAAIERKEELEEVPWSESSKYDVEILSQELEIIDKRRRLIACSPDLCVFLTDSGVETIDRQHLAVIQSQVNEMQ